MHHVENYDLIISRDPANDEREVLLLAAEYADVPEHLGSPLSARWTDSHGGRVIDILFEAKDGSHTPVRFAQITQELATKLSAFDRVLVVWLGENGVIGEEDLPLTA